MLIRKSERTAPKKPRMFSELSDKESNLNKVLSLLDWLNKDIKRATPKAKKKKKNPVFFKFSLILIFIR